MTEQSSQQMEKVIAKSVKSLVNPLLQVKHTLQDSSSSNMVPQEDNETLELINTLRPVPQESFNQSRLLTHLT